METLMKYVLTKRTINPEMQWLFSAYSEATYSVPIDLNGRTAAIFLNCQFAKARAEKLGWVDETDLYERKMQEEQEKVDQELGKNAKVKKRATRKRKTKPKKD
mgnify:CR=1 FL=1